MPQPLCSTCPTDIHPRVRSIPSLNKLRSRFPGSRWLLLFLALGSTVSQAQRAFVSVASPALAEPVLVAATEPAAISLPAPQPSGRIQGVVVDASGDLVPGAGITLERPGSRPPQTTAADGSGAFEFAHVAPGPYRLSVVAPGFKPWIALGTLSEGQTLLLTQITLPVSAVATEIEVSASSRDVAAAQLALEEKQRVLGVFPNFYASYVRNADPLSARQKFSLAWRFSVDPVAFAVTGVVAGTEQAQNSFRGYGQGARGYAKRYGAIYTDGLSSTLLGQAVFPVAFHQDPRYFVKGNGPLTTRFLYAVASTVVCKGDNGRWQPNYSNVLGNVTSAGISNGYYPASDRHGAMLTVQNSLVTTALGAIGGLFQEFLLHGMTPHLPDYDAVARQ